jgi:hypothetical protein
MKKRELYDLYEGLNNVAELKGVKFAYAVNKNKSKILSELKVLEKSAEASEEYKGYEKERIALCEEHAEKDKDGKANIVSGAYDIKDRATFDKALDALKETHKKALDDHANHVKDFEVLLETESEVEIHKIKLEEVPQEISVKQLENISLIIQE